MKRNKLTLTLVAGLLFCSSQAFGLVLVAEDFNDVTGIGTTQRTVQNILASDPTELPSGASWSVTPAATAAAVNVRHADNVINNNLAAVENLHQFFTPVNTANNFLVLGDNTTAINNEAISGISAFAIEFTNPVPGSALHIKFDYAFNGWDSATPTAGNSNFKVYLSDGTTSVDLVDYFSTYRVRPAVSNPNYAQGTFDQMVYTTLFNDDQLTLHFVMNEGTIANNALKNAAGGIDNILVEYEPPPVPEPSTFLLLGAGLGGLALLRRRRG